MLYLIAVIVVLAIVLCCVSYKQGEYAGYNLGYKVGYTEGGIEERLETKRQARMAITANLLDEACLQLFDDVMKGTCPVCMDAPVAKGQGACNSCLCDIYPDDPRSIHYAAGLPIGDSDEWKQWVDFGDDDPPNARAADSDMPF